MKLKSYLLVRVHIRSRLIFQNLALGLYPKIKAYIQYLRNFFRNYIFMRAKIPKYKKKMLQKLLISGRIEI